MAPSTGAYATGTAAGEQQQPQQLLRSTSTTVQTQQQDLTAVTPQTMTSMHHLIAGTTAGVTSTTALYPLDLIKTRYQAYDKGKSPYASLRMAFMTIVRQDGWRSLYSGLGPAVLGSGVSWGGYFYLVSMMGLITSAYLWVKFTVNNNTLRLQHKCRQFRQQKQQQ